MNAFIILILLVTAFFGYFAWKTNKIAEKSRAACPPKGKFINISTGRLHYTDEGTGPVIVMIHGLGSQLRSFTMAMSELLATDHRVIVMDRPGMGYSDRPSSASASLDAQAGYIEEMIDALGLEKPLIVGHSLGGAISMALALRAPDKIRGLALLAPLLRDPSAPAEVFARLKINSNAMRSFIAHTLAVPASIRNQAIVAEQVFGPDPIPADYTVNGGGLLSLQPKSFFNTSRDYVTVGPSIQAQTPRYGEIKVPVQILYGTEDRTLNFQEQGVQTNADHPQFKLELVEGAGHMLPTNYPERSDAFVRRVEAEL
ncbi:MAG: pimeloyl-ACP methyl ester carboxylesterase [Halocynthiibacter sp.]|jgi:pimeloyl-ACP methyl ester carboxylesterase